MVRLVWHHWRAPSCDAAVAESKTITVVKPSVAASLGVRLQVDHLNPQPVVVALVPGGLCEAAGICLGDTILAIDGKPTRGQACEVTSVLKAHAAGKVVLSVKCVRLSLKMAQAFSTNDSAAPDIKQEQGSDGARETDVADSDDSL